MTGPEGLRVVVTSGGSGIGRATAVRLATAGAAVAVLDVRGHDEVAEISPHMVPLACDVSDAAAVQSAV
ncbi:SDR family NAD(P)-dependent oxidoreductase [Pseudonocardia oroxyli]|uniref:Meso-butanediol dehydrogenase / (S,S)-butanediol dehydrogenase / diacetyl reductase n=1 Tax=Pseudonocardia oroxyli TaxID=366584 RepID=A0A1G7XXY2_PSEOR|nr:SDR family NAD(P)-dependent oxidoreductase [Pseudonocardia oroxyli]SDG88943.1 meso-butanediol dehydrogenase / (S,S)-butanediol dehydrogenase / diacetyl reductase [Pseudonocardia oroxyli]